MANAYTSLVYIVIVMNHEKTFGNGFLLIVYLLQYFVDIIVRVFAEELRDLAGKEAVWNS